MSQSITLSIPTICTQEWSAMQLVSDGRHCMSCQRVVHDFTQFSDAELVTWFAQHKGPACGRFRTDQLNLPLYADQSVARPGIRGWVRWVVALVLGWQTARAQTGIPATNMTRQTVAPIGSKEPLSTDKPDSVLFFVRGRVVHGDGKPAEIGIRKGQNQAPFLSDSTGHFQIPIYLSDQHDSSLLLTFSNRVTYSISTLSEQAPLLIKLPSRLSTVVMLPPGIKIAVGGVQVSRSTDPKQSGPSPQQPAPKR